MATSSRPRKRDGTKSTSNSNNNNAVSVSPAPLGSNSADDSSVIAPLDEEDDPNFPLPLFYDTTFSAHRVSPLYLGNSKEGDLSNKRLGVLAQRLRDLLVGDVVRGVEIGLGGPAEDSAMGRYGALERVGIRWFRLGMLLDVEPLPTEEDDEEGQERDGNWEDMVKRLEALRDKKGNSVLQISLEYENHMFEALLLPSLSTKDEEDTETTKDEVQFYVGEAGKHHGKATRQGKGQFLNMPLLLLRMPPPLKIVIAEFLATTFDCRVSSLRLGTRSMLGALESWFRTVGVQSRGSLAKDITLWLGFYFPADKDKDSAGNVEHDRGDEDEEDGRETGHGPGQGQLGVKSIDVSIPVSDLKRFVDAGRELLDGGVERKSGPFGEPWGWETGIRKRRKLAGRLYEEGWEWRESESGEKGEKEEYPFTEALGRYIDRHLGLNIFHPGVRVTKVACGGFVMSEGKLKVFKPANLGENGAQGVGASSPGQRGGVLGLVAGLVEKAGVSPERFLV